MTLSKIAEISQVSISTVSKILNGKDENISSSTRERVLSVLKEHNYTRRSNSSGKTFVIGVIFNSKAGGVQLMNSICKTVQRQGYSLLIRDSNGCPAQERQNFESLSSSTIDGLIWQPVADSATITPTDYFDDTRMPVATIDPQESQLGYREATITAIQKFINLGHNQICLLCNEDSHNKAAIEEGIQAAIKDQYLSAVRCRMVYSPEELSDCILNNGTSAVICCEWSNASAVTSRLFALKINVPQDISVICITELEVADSSVSCIAIPYESVGQQVGDYMVSRCEKRGHEPLKYTADYRLSSEISIKPPQDTNALKIVVVGGINVDTILNVDEQPQLGKTIKTENYSVGPGGKGANQAVAVARLGHEVSLIGSVGNDIESIQLYRSLEADNVSTIAVEKDDNHTTGKAFIHLQNNGESSITVLAGANSCLSSYTVRRYEKLFKEASYCLLQSEIPTEALYTTLDLSQKHNVTTFLKPSALKTVDAKLLENVDFFMPNRSEAAMLCNHGNTLKETADYFLSLGVKNVIITLDSEGGYFKNGSTEYYYDAKKSAIVDTTGAADSFIAAFAAYLSYGLSIKNALHVASYAASFCISRQGVIPSLVRRRTLEQYIRNCEPQLLEELRGKS